MQKVYHPSNDITDFEVFEINCFCFRNTLERLYGEKVNEKRASVESQGNYANVLDAFERHVDSDRNQANERRNANHFNCGTLCIILSFIVGVIIVS